MQIQQLYSIFVAVFSTIECYEVNHAMKWSKWVKISGGIFCVLSVLGTLIIGMRIQKVFKIYDNTLSIDIPIAIVLTGILISVVIGSALMLLCEIGDEVCNIKYTIIKLNNSNSDSPNALSYTSSSQWKCPNCGKLNPQTKIFCTDCGKSK